MLRGLSELLTIERHGKKVFRVSEWVSPGHPDKTCDYISSYLLDRNLEKDPKTRFAVEAMLKDQQCTLGGEVTGKANFNDDQIRWFARNAISEIGYTREYQDRWGRKNAICGEDVDVFPTISRQSPDIARGVDRDAWGDQGIFFGMAVREPSTGFMPKDHYLARALGMKLYKAARESGFGGLDIKTMVACRGDEVRNVVVAIPLQDEKDIPKVKDIAVAVTGCENVVVNGTGSYVTHSSIGDCGVTGRKLAVDFYGGNCPIGGGCVDGETEYLSPDGWRKISEYDGGDVGQVDDEFNLSFVKPERFIDTFSDEVYDIPMNKAFSMRLSGNHNVVYRTSKGNYRKKPLNEILSDNEMSERGFHGEIPRFFNYTFPNGVRKYTDVVARIVIAHCADGTILDGNKRFNCRISLKRERKIERLRKLLVEAGIDYSERNNRDGFTRFYFHLDNPSKKLCEQFKNPDLETATLISEEIYKWDGSEEFQEFRTTQKRDADFIQFIMSAVTGNCYSLLMHKQMKENKNPCYIVRAISNVFSTPFRKKNGKTPIRKLIPQKVYCFTVPTGKLLLRRQNGIFVTGNSPWTKDPTKADLTLNIHARQLALDFMNESGRDFVQAALSCRIGGREVDVSYRDEHGREIDSERVDCPPSELIRKYGLDRPIYTRLCMEGLFSVCD